MPASYPPFPASCETEIDLPTGMGQIQIQIQLPQQKIPRQRHTALPGKT